MLYLSQRSFMLLYSLEYRESRLVEFYIENSISVHAISLSTVEFMFLSRLLGRSQPVLASFRTNFFGFICITFHWLFPLRVSLAAANSRIPGVCSKSNLRSLIGESPLTRATPEQLQARSEQNQETRSDRRSAPLQPIRRRPHRLRDFDHAPGKTFTAADDEASGSLCRFHPDPCTGSRAVSEDRKSWPVPRGTRYLLTFDLENRFGHSALRWPGFGMTDDIA